MKTEVCGEIRLCDFALTPANFKTEFIVGLKRYPKVLPCKLFYSGSRSVMAPSMRFIVQPWRRREQRVSPYPGLHDCIPLVEWQFMRRFVRNITTVDDVDKPG